MPELLRNKKAFFDYETMEKFEAGLELLGVEVKAIKNGRATIVGGRIIARGNEVYLVGANIAPYQSANAPAGYDALRPRRLLLTKAEIKKLTGVEHERGLTIIPLSVYTKGPLIKLSLAVARGKKKHDKRESLKRREDDKRIRRTLKS